MSGNVKVIVTCNVCGKTKSTTSKNIEPCKCGSLDLSIDDQWESFLDKYATRRYDHWNKSNLGG